MTRALLVALSLLLVAASPDEVAPALEDNGYFIEPGASATDEVVSDAVFEARAEGGRLNIVVLAEEPPGGATTFSDAVLDDLGGVGYVLTVAPETVGYAGDGSFWSASEMDAAVEASLQGGDDDDVVERFVVALTGAPSVPGGEGEGEAPEADGSGFGWVWLVVIGGGALLVWAMMRRGSKQREQVALSELEKVRAMAAAKLAEVANDILEMEPEVQLSENPEVKAHYQRASTTYTDILARMEQEPGPAEMLEIVKDLDLAIWELDAAEALLDGKPIPEKPKAPEPPPAPRRQPEPVPVPEDTYGRRPHRQSSYAGSDLMTALWAILAMSGRGGWGGGWGGGFGGPMRGGGGRMRGGGMRMGGGFGGRIRGGGRR